MVSWFECKVKYSKIDEKSGKEKTVTEAYLIDAVSFSDAEERVFKEMESLISGEFMVVAIKRVNYSDIFCNNDGERYYKARVTFSAIDEASGSEKKVVNNMLVFASSVEDANIKLKEGLEGISINYDLISVSESSIIDVFNYKVAS